LRVAIKSRPRDQCQIAERAALAGAALSFSAMCWVAATPSICPNLHAEIRENFFRRLLCVAVRSRSAHQAQIAALRRHRRARGSAFIPFVDGCGRPTCPSSPASFRLFMHYGAFVHGRKSSTFPARRDSSPSVTTRPATSTPRPAAARSSWPTATRTTASTRPAIASSFRSSATGYSTNLRLTDLATRSRAVTVDRGVESPAHPDHAELLQSAAGSGAMRRACGR